MTTLSRHDFTKAERDLLNKDVEIGVIDPVELGVMIHNLGADCILLFGDLTLAAYSNIHSEPRIHSEWVSAFDAFNTARTQG